MPFLFLWNFAVSVRPNSRPIGASRMPSALSRHGEQFSNHAFDPPGNRPPAHRLELMRSWTHSRRVKRTRQQLTGRRRAWNLLNRYNLTRDPRIGVLQFVDRDIILLSELNCRHSYLADPYNTRCLCGQRKWPEESLNCCELRGYCVPRHQSIPPAIESR